jgi:hypothetical protein
MDTPGRTDGKGMEGREGEDGEPKWRGEAREGRWMGPQYSDQVGAYEDDEVLTAVIVTVVASIQKYCRTENVNDALCLSMALLQRRSEYVAYNLLMN